VRTPSDWRIRGQHRKEQVQQNEWIGVPSSFSQPDVDPAVELQRLKLEDGIQVHERAKVDLEVFAREQGQRIVKPFMLVIAQDTEHANKVEQIIKADDFFEGRYKDRVITVHSNQTGEEKDEVIERLLAVEDPKEPTEIVIHVNMLKEGWDGRRGRYAAC